MSAAIKELENTLKRMKDKKTSYIKTNKVIDLMKIKLMLNDINSMKLTIDIIKGG